MKEKGRRVLSFILTAVMVFALLPVFGKPMVVKADDTPAEHVAHENKDTDGSNHSNWKKISSWDNLKNLGKDGGSGYLSNNIEISETFTIESDITVNLCLNGCSITQTENSNTITVKGTLNLYDKKDNSGKITHASEKNGSGVKIENNGTFTMNGGTISGNNTTDYDGGVRNDGTFTMNGGTITGNNADHGGGVINYGTFTMTEGTISGNNADYGGGVENDGTFTMEGGTISGNNAIYGGGVLNDVTFTMTGGAIEGNKATIEGGGVFNFETFTMEGGTILGNKAEYGGGVYNHIGTFKMEGGTISGNNASYGGGVENYGTFKMEGGTIKKNKASERGSGVYSSYSFVKEGGEIDGSIENLGRNICAITFNANDGSDKTIIQYVISNKDTNLAPNKFSYGNYIFGCWNTMADGTGDSYEDNATINIKGDLELYARWIEKSYDVTFKVNNGSWFDKTNDDIVVTILRYVGENKELKLNASNIPTLGNPDTGYKSSGNWDTEPDTVNELTENKTYTYTFAPIEYTVEYYPNGGVGTMLDQERKYDDKKPLTTNAFTLEGYTFNGWNTAADGSGTSYADKNDSNLSSTDGETVKLFAQWQANKYTVKFDSNGGDGRMEDQDRAYDDKAPLTTNTFTFEGKTFNGWNTAADGSGTHFKDGEVNNLSSTEGDTVTLYAQWTTNTYTVSWKDYDGTVLETDTDVAYGSTPSYDGETPIKEKEGNKEYTFSGWTPAIDIVKGAATYTATYSENEIIYTVTFDANGGKADTTTGTTNAEFKLSSLPTPTYEGYTFKGWFTEATGGSKISADTVYTQDTTIYAQWEKVEEPEEPTTPEEPQEPAEPEVPEITEPEPEPEIPEKDWLDDLRLKLQIANELGGPQTVEYSGDFALSYDIMQYLVEHPDITFVYHVTYEGVEYTITISGGKAIADSNIPWYGPLWLLANYGGDKVPEIMAGSGKYTVVEGDTLSGIAAKFNTTVEELAKKNGIKNPDYIIVGQVIVY